MRRSSIAAALLWLLAGGSGWAQEYEPPVVGRPDHFSGAVGRSFRVAMLAPPELVVGQPFTLTVRVTAQGPWARAPRRPALQELPEWTKGFQLVRPDSDFPDREVPDRRHDLGPDPRRPVRQAPCVRTTPAEQQSWEFDYELSPIDISVTAIPGFEFHYYQPPPVPGLRGRFPTAYADELPVKVLPAVVKENIKAPVVAPETFFQLITGPAVLRNEGLVRLPSWPLLILLLAGPPLAAGVWYLAWKRLYPDAARLARLHRSQAARRALRDLETKTGATVDQVSAIAAQYLRHRFGLPCAEPTPDEVLRHLEKAGAVPALAGRAAEFFRNCDTARFSPPPHEPGALAAAARLLILNLEGETWSHS